jgi:hypothetical protein
MTKAVEARLPLVRDAADQAHMASEPLSPHAGALSVGVSP